jgi:MSHA biogenesis protein MshN
MSVINKMLRDLDQRNHNAANVNQVIARRPGQPLWLTVLLLLTFGLLCFAIYAVLSRSTVMPPATLTAVVPEPAAQLPAEPATPAEIAIAAHSPEPTDSLEPKNSPEPAPTESPASTPGPALTQSTIVKTGLVSEQTATPQDTAAASTAQPQPQPQQITPGEVTAQVDAVPQAAAVVQAAAPTAKTASSLSVTSREPTAAQSQAKLRQQAMAAAQAGQGQQALRYWQQLQQLAPQDALVYLAQARLWLQLGQPQQAEASLLQAKAQGIMDADIQLMLAQAAASRQQWLQVEALLPASFAVALYPDYYGLKATALQQLGQHQQAFDWFTELSTLQPQLGKWWLGGAVSLEALDRPAEAHQYYLNALQWGDSLSVQSKTYIQQRLVATE